MKLTSSNFAAAMGVSPWQSRQKLFRVMTGLENRDAMNANMQWGIDNEHRAVAAAEAITGEIFLNTGEGQIHYESSAGMSGKEEWSWGTTPDGDNGDNIGLEVKCPQALKDDVPDHYLPQVQGQIYIAGFDSVVFCQWTPEESRAWRVTHSIDYIDHMVELLDEFMLCLVNGEQPKRRKKPVMPEIKTERIK